MQSSWRSIKLILFISGLFMSHVCYASILQIINAADLPIEIIIQPEEGTEGPDFPEIHKIVQKDQILIMELDRKQLGKVDTYSVTGKVNFYTLSDRCINLDFKKDYIITLSHKLEGGVRCVAIETPKRLEVIR
jgi:hypothetical protein